MAERLFAVEILRALWRGFLTTVMGTVTCVAFAMGVMEGFALMFGREIASQHIAQMVATMVGGVPGILVARWTWYLFE
jgi:hypothetical protein